MPQEKITLVLDVEGVSDLKTLKQTIDDVSNAMGATVKVVDQLGDTTAETADQLDNLNETINPGGGGGNRRNPGGGKGGSKGGGSKSGLADGLLQIGYAIDDLQYGFRGIVNNVPQVVQALGLGAGFAGGAQIAAVVANQLSTRISELIIGKEKYKSTLASLLDPLNDFQQEIEFQREELEKLGKEYKATIEQMDEYRAKLENLKQQEEELRKQRERQRAAEEQAKDPGKLATEKVGKYKQAYDEIVTEAGIGQQVEDQLTETMTQAGANQPLTDAQTRERDLYMGQNAKRYLRELQFEGDTYTQEEIDAAKKRAGVDWEIARQKSIRDKSRAAAKDILGGLKTARTPEEFDEYLQQLAQINPDLARQVMQQYHWNIADEKFDKELNEFREANQERRKKQAEFNRNLQGPGFDRDGMNIPMAEMDRVMEMRRVEEQVDMDNQRKAKLNAEAAQEKRKREMRQEALDQRREQAAELWMRNQNVNPLQLAMQAYNSVQGRSQRADQERRLAAVQQRDMIAARIANDTGMPEVEARRAATSVMQQGEKAAQQLQRMGQVTVDGFGRLIYTARAQQRDIDNVLRLLGGDLPNWQGGARPR